MAHAIHRHATTSADRRAIILAAPVLLGGALVQAQRARAEDAPPDITVVADKEGFGKHPAAPGDLVLFHYVGTLEPSGVIFDSTRGGVKYQNGGAGVFRPAAVRIGGDPVPGLVKGLRLGLEGMHVGGTRTIIVSPELGFGSKQVGAPYAVVQPGSTLRYEIELLRLSARGPDDLTRGIAQCGAGGAGAQAAACEDIEYAEFL
ncbi:hypothetical protein FOA52_006180 [Chlamydomonas sp. UWO 241]|nr:hypothetical protein FOA52_006180 [Chlamydomonas sp. UWO 241]